MNTGNNAAVNALPPVETETLRDFLTKCWLTHDGMWFYNAYREAGIETANLLNQAAIRAMVPLEINRAKKILGIKNKRFGSFEELYGFMLATIRMVLPASLLEKFTTEITGPGTFTWEWEKGECFAYRGVSMLGCIDRYECGVLLRIKCWLDVLGVEFRMEPEIKGCMMHEKGYCRGEIVCEFPEA